MNDADLDRLLKSARVPEREAEYWNDFPGRVLAATRHPQVPVVSRRFPWPGRVAWGLGVAAACVVALLAISFWPDRKIPTRATNGSSRPAEYRFAELREMFPNQIRAIVLSDTDARIDLAETANQSDTQPIYLKVCGPDGCKQVITFSGQHIRLNGEEWEVLASGPDGVIVTGDQSVWTSAEPSRQLSHFHIEARQLKAS